MDITILQMKKSLLLLNKLHRQKFKSYLVKTPSKLSPDELKQFFTLLFMKKENHYVPKQTIKKLDIDENEFKKIFVKPTKTPKPRTPKQTKVIPTKPKNETVIKRTTNEEQIKENDKPETKKEEVKEVIMKNKPMKTMTTRNKMNDKMKEIMKLNNEIRQLFETYYRLANITIITNDNNDRIDMTVEKINIILKQLKEYNLDCNGLTCINNLKNSRELNKLSDEKKYKYLYKIFKDEKYFMKK